MYGDGQAGLKGEALRFKLDRRNGKADELRQNRGLSRIASTPTTMPILTEEIDLISTR